MSNRNVTFCQWFTNVPDPDTSFPGKNVSTFNCSLNRLDYSHDHDHQMVNNGFNFCPFCGKPITQTKYEMQDILA
jgi:hypothetical protein